MRDQKMILERLNATQVSNRTDNLLLKELTQPESAKKNELGRNNSLDSGILFNTQTSFDKKSQRKDKPTAFKTVQTLKTSKNNSPVQTQPPSKCIENMINKVTKKPRLSVVKKMTLELDQTPTKSSVQKVQS
jgi:hypothetical protein